MPVAFPTITGTSTCYSRVVAMDVTEVADVQKTLYLVSHDSHQSAGSQSDSKGARGIWHLADLGRSFFASLRKSIVNSGESGQ